MKKWLTGWGIAGLIAPLLYLVVHFVASYDLFIFPFWPGSIGLMALEGQPSTATIVMFWLITVSSNVVLYAVIGILLWPLACRESKGPHSERWPAEIPRGVGGDDG